MISKPYKQYYIKMPRHPDRKIYHLFSNAGKTDRNLNEKF